MDRRKWDSVERVLDLHGVHPIVAVIPNNQDPKLKSQEPDPEFWQRVRAWAAKGWSVAMHGHTHVMHSTVNALLLPFYKRSEFAGLSLAAQAEKIRTAWQLFLTQRVEPTIWVAPAHSFDLLTLEAIRNETRIRVVSDGIAFNTFFEHGFHWIPQQLWGFTARSFGLWTICLHPNTMDDAGIAALDDAIGGRFRDHVICVKDVKLTGRRKHTFDRLYSKYFWWRWKRALRTA
jgi:hypothetical protein